MSEANTACKQLCPVLGCVQLFMTLGLYVACQAPLSTEIFRQEYWGGLPFPSPEDLPDPGIKPAFLASPALQADSLPTEPLEKPINLQLKRKEKEKKKQTASPVIFPIDSKTVSCPLLLKEYSSTS